MSDNRGGGVELFFLKKRFQFYSEKNYIGGYQFGSEKRRICVLC